MKKAIFTIGLLNLAFYAYAAAEALTLGLQAIGAR